MKRNTIFGAAALLVAGAAIGAGSVVSQNAMAATGEPAETSQLTMVSIGEDGTAIECTFEGSEAAGLIPEPPAGFPIDGTTIEGNMVIGMGEILPADGTLPELQLPEGVLPTDGQVVSGAVTVAAAVDGAEMTINGAPLETREGTAEECAAMHDGAIQVATALPDGATIIGSDGVTISSGAVQVSAEAVKP